MVYSVNHENKSGTFFMIVRYIEAHAMRVSIEVEQKENT
jgi:hypothetical protein